MRRKKKKTELGEGQINMVQNKCVEYVRKKNKI